MRNYILEHRIAQVAFSIIIIGLAIVLFQSCNMQKYCMLRFPSRDSTTITERVVYKDTVIRIPGDTLMFTDILPCPDYDTTVNSMKQIIRVVVKDRMITATGICKEDSLKARITWLEKFKSTVKTMTVENKVTPTWNFILLGALSIIIVYLLIKLITK